MPKRRKRARSRKGKRRKAMPVVIMRRRRHVSMSQRMIAKTCTRTLIYSEYTNIDNAGDAVSSVYRCNDLFDPTVAVGGHQPLGFDQMMTLYNKFVVLRSSITCMFSCATTAAGAAHTMVGIRLEDTAGTLPVLLTHLIELRRCKYKMIGYSNGANNQKTIKYSVRPWKFLGLSSPKDETEYWGSAVASPVMGCDWSVFSVPVDDTTNSPGIQTVTRIAYKTLFFEPQTELAQS